VEIEEIEDLGRVSDMRDEKRRKRDAARKFLREVGEAFWQGVLLAGTTGWPRSP
jgi:hypothetical protein